MPGRIILALASMMAVVCLVSVPGQAALISHWALDDVPTALGDTLVDSVGDRDLTVNTQAYFGGGDVLSTTGREGIADTAVQFHDYRTSNQSFGEYLYSVDPNDPDDPFNIVESANYNGGLLGHLGDFMVESWFRFDASGGSLFSESITSRASSDNTGGGGPVTMLTTHADGSLWFAMWSAVVGDDPEAPRAPPPSGDWVTGQWYYAAGVYVPPILERDANGDVLWGDPYPNKPLGLPVNTIETGLVSVYVWDGTTLTSDSAVADSILVYGDAGNAYDVDNFRLRGGYCCGVGGPTALDDFSIYDIAFDPNSFLVSVLGIPEPSSLAVLALGGLLLARRRRGA